MKIITKYNRELLEENLPDYLFGKLPEEERVEFSEALKQFPDLLKVSENLQETYSSVSKENFDRIAYNATLEIPSKILSGLKFRKPNRTWQILSRSLFYTVPTAAVILIAYFILPSSFWNNDLEQDNKSRVISFNDNELMGLDDEYPLGWNGDNNNKPNGFTKEEFDILNEYTEDFYETIYKTETEKSIKQRIEPSYNYDKSENSYTELNEQEIDQILQEIENVNFKTTN
jgi:hypothetical protein